MLEQEPPDADDPILKLDNVILAPHALCWTDQCFAGNGAADVKAVLDVQHGREPRGVVNREVLCSRRLEEAAGRLRRAFRNVDAESELGAPPRTMPRRRSGQEGSTAAPAVE